MESVKYCSAASYIQGFIEQGQDDERLFQESVTGIAVTTMLVQFRLQADITQAQFGDRVGRSEPNIARLEEGAYERCTLSALRTFARALGHDIDLSSLFHALPQAIYSHHVGVAETLDDELNSESTVDGPDIALAKEPTEPGLKAPATGWLAPSVAGITPQADEVVEPAGVGATVVRDTVPTAEWVARRDSPLAASEHAEATPIVETVPVSETGLLATQATRAEAALAVELAAAQQQAAQAANDKRRARAQAVWERVVAGCESGEVLIGTVTSAVKGGLLVDVDGIRGFLPASQTRVPQDGTIEALVKTKVPLKVIDIDGDRRRIVVSQRRAMQEERGAKRRELLRSLAVGQVREGVVVRLADFGAFVDLGGIDGLVPMRELAFERVEKVGDVLKVGEKLNVEVLRIEEGGKKILLSRKNALPDPWRDHAKLLGRGTIIEGKVISKERGLAIELAPGVTGNVREDEINPDDYAIGETVEVSVRNVDRVRRRINLTTLHEFYARASAATDNSDSPFFTVGREYQRS